MTNTPTTSTEAPSSFHDLLDELCEIGFCPMDTDADGIFPAWVFNWRAGNRVAIALTQTADVLVLEEEPSDGRWVVTLYTTNGIERYSGSFPITRTGATLMLALLTAAVEL